MRLDGMEGRMEETLSSRLGGVETHLQELRLRLGMQNLPSLNSFSESESGSVRTDAKLPEPLGTLTSLPELTDSELSAGEERESNLPRLAAQASREAQLQSELESRYNGAVGRGQDSSRRLLEELEARDAEVKRLSDEVEQERQRVEERAARGLQKKDAMDGASVTARWESKLADLRASATRQATEARELRLELAHARATAAADAAGKRLDRFLHEDGGTRVPAAGTPPALTGGLSPSLLVPTTLGDGTRTPISLRASVQDTALAPLQQISGKPSTGGPMRDRRRSAPSLQGVADRVSRGGGNTPTSNR